MVERILSTAELHRYLLEVPSLVYADCKTRYNSTIYEKHKNFGYKSGAVEKYRIPTVLVTNKQTV